MTESQESKPEANIHIQISGDEETHYAAQWTIITMEGETQRVEDSGRVPASYAYQGKSISGTVTQLSEAGRLEVEIRKDGNRSRSATQGKGSVLSIRVH